MTLDALHRAMADAVAAQDFEEAARLRDRISIARSTGADPDAIDAAGLTRSRPGAMGLGSGQARVVPPEGWVKPKKPDPMTRGRPRAKG